MHSNHPLSPFNRQPPTPFIPSPLSGTATQRIIGRSPPLRTQILPGIPLLLRIVLRIPKLAERERWCAQPHTMLAALDSAEIDPLTPGLVFALAHTFLSQLTLLLLTSNSPSLLTATLLCCCCRLLSRKNIRSLTFWFFRHLAALNLIGTALLRQDLVRERTTRLHRFLRLARYAAIVEDTAARAEFADAGVVLSADVAGLFGDACQ